MNASKATQLTPVGHMTVTTWSTQIVLKKKVIFQTRRVNGHVRESQVSI